MLGETSFGGDVVSACTALVGGGFGASIRGCGRLYRWPLVLLVLLLLGSGASAADPAMLSLIEDVFSYARTQETNTIAYLQATYGSTYLTQYPRSTNRTSGVWTDVRGAADWTSGFFPGTLWLTYQRTGDASLLAMAKGFTAGIESVDGDGGIALDHDQGFRFLTSFYQGYRASNNANDPGGVYHSQAVAVLKTAATGVDLRFNQGGIPVNAVRCLDTYLAPYPTAADTFMNYPLLFTAWDLSGRPASGTARQWYDHAVTSVRTQIAEHVRPDGGTYHIVQHNDGSRVNRIRLSSNGAVWNKSSDQGFASESTWSRGQTWAMYGLTETYRFTRDDPSANPQQFLDAARLTSDYFINHLPNNNTADPYNHVVGDFVPPSDFDASLGEPVGYWNGTTTGSNTRGAARAGTHAYTFRDSSAAASGASALLALSELDPDPLRRQKYFTAAEDILRSLMTFRGSDGKLDYLAKDTNQMGILTAAAHSWSATDTGTSWSFGDYYFLEALQRYEAITVPEPGTLGLVSLAALHILTRRPRRVRGK